jgi:hypothetical protein
VIVAGALFQHQGSPERVPYAHAIGSSGDHKVIICQALLSAVISLPWPIVGLPGRAHDGERRADRHHRVSLGLFR